MKKSNGRVSEFEIDLFLAVFEYGQRSLPRLRLLFSLGPKYLRDSSAYSTARC